MKLERERVAVNRRTVVTVAAGVALGLAAQRASAAASAPIADAHLHIFNGSDLPVGAFVRYVVIPDRFPSLPAWVGAVADLAVNVIKPLAVSVRREAGKPTVSLASAGEITPESFGQAVSDYIAARSGSPAVLAERSATPFDPALAVSYRALLEEITPIVGTGAGFIRDPTTNTFALRLEDRDATRRTFQALALLAEAPTAPPPNPQNKSLLEQLSLLGGAGRMIGWLYLMCKSRQSHIDKYLRDYSTKSVAPRLIINHLIDFDRWLNDAPSPDSPHLEQVALLATLAKRNKVNVDLRTFAGFCPLKNALENAASPTAPTTLSALQAAYGRGDIAGFKLYPPMGFQPYGNTQLGQGPQGDQVFARPAGSDEVVLKQWGAVSKKPLGAALDASLADFYQWCARHDVPLMAHGGPGNQAAPGFGQRANPKWWELAQKVQPTLRLNIGHLINKALPFVTSVETQTPDCQVWALDAAVRLLGAGRAGTIYGDLAYMPELIENKDDLNRRFFRALKQTFGSIDKDLRHILYGTDWVFLGLESGNDNFLQTVIDGMTAANYTQVEKDNILYLNARRFMKIDPV